MLALFFCHWYARGAVPVAATENVAAWPAVTPWFAGWVENAGALAFVDVAWFVVPIQPHNASENARRIAAVVSGLRPASIWKSSSVLSLTLERGQSPDSDGNHRLVANILGQSRRENTCSQDRIWSKCKKWNFWAGHGAVRPEARRHWMRRAVMLTSFAYVTSDWRALVGARIEFRGARR
jgi:hypothetical protein